MTQPGPFLRSMTAVALVPLLVTVMAACGVGTEPPARPPITRPLDAAAFRDRVCHLLPVPDATRLGYSAPGSESKAYRDGSDEPYVYSFDRLPPKSRWLVIDLYLTEDRLALRLHAARGQVERAAGGWSQPN